MGPLLVLTIIPLKHAGPRRRDIARWIRDCYQLSIRRSCKLSCLRLATWYYHTQARQCAGLRQRMRELATAEFHLLGICVRIGHTGTTEFAGDNEPPFKRRRKVSWIKKKGMAMDRRIRRSRG